MFIITSYYESFKAKHKLYPKGELWCFEAGDLIFPDYDTAFKRVVDYLCNTHGWFTNETGDALDLNKDDRFFEHGDTVIDIDGERIKISR